jgi:hypothetical protein
VRVVVALQSVVRMIPCFERNRRSRSNLECPGSAPVFRDARLSRVPWLATNRNTPLDFGLGQTEMSRAAADGLVDARVTVFQRGVAQIHGDARETRILRQIADTIGSRDTKPDVIHFPQVGRIEPLESIERHLPLQLLELRESHIKYIRIPIRTPTRVANRIITQRYRQAGSVFGFLRVVEPRQAQHAEMRPMHKMYNHFFNGGVTRNV